MKDKIVYLVIGMLIATVIMLLTTKTSNLTADEKRRIFDNVLIKGTLYIGDEDNRIVLDAENDASNIVLESKDAIIAIGTRPNLSMILITPDTENKEQIGAFISSLKHENGKVKTLISLTDEKGNNNTIVPTD